jgi:endoglucanase
MKSHQAYRSILFCVMAGLSFAGVRTAAADAAFLKTNGAAIRNGEGRGDVVTLRGVNIGGWLLMEGWMTPMDRSGLKDDGAVRDMLAMRFGPKTRDELVAAYEDAWMQESDLDNIRAFGMNVVRLPFWYPNLQDDKGARRPDAFARLDWLVEKAWARGIYTVLDLHGAPGGQSKADTTGRERSAADLWTGDDNLARTTEIWKRVAEHYRGNPAVAGYDLLNEPIGAPDRDTLWSTYDRLYKVVRAADPDHIVFIEGCWAGKVAGKDVGWCWDVLPDPARFGWSNVVYEMHAYGFANAGDDATQLREIDKQVEDARKHRAWGVPCYIGEFNCFDHEQAWRYALEQYKANGFSLSTWSYKAMHGTGEDSWGMYDPRSPVPKSPDIRTDGADAIRRNWAQWSTPKAFAVNPMLLRVFTGKPAAPR